MNPLGWLCCVSLLCSVAVTVKAANRCGFSDFDCKRYSNPCSPTLCTDGKHRYPTSWLRQYVQCGAGGACSIEKCVLGEVYDDQQQECVDRNGDANNWGLVVPADEGFISEDRCHNDNGHILDGYGEPLKFNCRRHNPCLEGRCNPSVLNYPGRNEMTYVSCGIGDDEGLCTELRCPQYREFDVSSQTCVVPADRCYRVQYFNCKQKNPCLAPRCFPADENRFPYNENNSKYVECVDTNEALCQIVTCDEGLLYSDADKDCVAPRP